jgi:hypothetical protein
MAQKETKSEILGTKLERKTVLDYAGEINGMQVGFCAGHKRLNVAPFYQVLINNTWFKYFSKEDCIEAIESKTVAKGVKSF